MPLPLSSLDTGTGEVALTSDERNYIREVLGVSKLTTDSKYKVSEARFNSFIGYENKSARYWMALYESKGESTMVIDAEGADFSKTRDRQRIALALYNLVFSDGTVTPLEDIALEKYDERRTSVKMVPIQHFEDDVATSEY